MEKLENIEFDKEDQELFLIDDLQLKADAIRNSILPKMEVVMNYAISLIDKVYGVNVFDDCMIAQAPHYRLNNRPSDVKKDYQFARVSIRGKRGSGRWNGINKPNGDELQVSPFSMDMKLIQDGLFISLSNNQEISKESNKKVFDFLTKNKSAINIIQKTARVFDDRIHTGNDWLVSDEKWLKNKFNKSDFDISIFSDYIFYPIKYNQLSLAIDRLTLLYPIFHSYICIAKGESTDFDNLIIKANNWLIQKSKDDFSNQHENDVKVDINSVKERAGKKIKVMPGIRWQVFQRDSWRCVACGRSADDGIILHVDHILPRSKGGRDEISNYQTLCFDCNIGKSDGDDTDLRSGRIKN